MSTKLDSVKTALKTLTKRQDLAELSDGLSKEMAGFCLENATKNILTGIDQAIAVPGIPPNTALVIAARGVFTSPIEWVSLLAAMGTKVFVKAPKEAPLLCQALAYEFTSQNLDITVFTSRDLPKVDAVVAMGGDQAISNISSAYPFARTSLHGHRFSVIVVKGATQDLGMKLALDACLYDGRGCFTPVAIFSLGDPYELESYLVEGFRHFEVALPLGRPDQFHGPERRRRIAKMLALGTHKSGKSWDTGVISADFLEPSALSRFLPIHPINSINDLKTILSPWIKHLSTCATNLSVEEIPPIFERICRPGKMQLPPINRTHGGQEMIRPLMFQISNEL